MHTKRIIPCLDVKDGRVVKGVNFVNFRDAGDPAEVAEGYDREGADELVFLDITASADDRATQLEWVRKVAGRVFIPFTVGGGIRTVEDFRAILREGADKVSVNSAAIMEPRLISDAADRFGSQCVVVAIDAKRREDGGWNIYKNGGRIDMGMDAVEWAVRAEALGAGEILLTSMDRDGTGEGYDLELTRMVSIQMGPQTRMLQNNDTLMVEKIQSSLVNTIPLWKSQMVLALGLENSRKATAAQTAVTNATNELLRKNAEMLKMGTIATAKEAERSIIDIETLQHTNQQLISTLDEVIQIQREGAQKRKEAEVELGRIEGELKQKLMELRS